MSIAVNGDNGAEIFPIVTPEGTVIGKASRAECHNGSKLLHPVVHLHVFDRQGNLYLQKRPVWKDIQPGRWDTAVGGHVDYGEDTEQALLREAAEELGITGFEYRKAGAYVFESSRERELVNVFITITDIVPRPSAEVDGGRFWSQQEIMQAMGKDILTPNFESEYRRLFIENE